MVVVVVGVVMIRLLLSSVAWMVEGVMVLSK